MSVPENLISVESQLSHYGIKSKRRSDIIIHGNDEKGTVFPLCVVECKAPDIPLTENTQNQVFDYCDEVDADYAIMSNGYYTDCYKYDKDKNRYVRLSEIPSFEELLGGKYIEYDWGEFPERTPFDELERDCQMVREKAISKIIHLKRLLWLHIIYWSVFWIIMLRCPRAIIVCSDSYKIMVSGC